MDFDLDQRTASLSVGEFSAFVTGPRDATGGPQGVWRAQLGTHWHNELRARAASETPAIEFEVPIAGRVVHHGWTIALTGRIDQLRRTNGEITLREIKTVTRELPADESELRAAYPDYFAQLATYGVLTRLGGLGQSRTLYDIAGVRSELWFVEVASGLAQTIPLTAGDEAFFKVQLERVVEFLDLRLRARERLRHLRFRPAFDCPRPGQETTEADLTAMFERHPLVLFEAPTGFGKTGVLLEFALAQLRSGHFDRLLYLTSKSTGQLQVVQTLAKMTRSEKTEGGRITANGQPTPDGRVASPESAAPPAGRRAGEARSVERAMDRFAETGSAPASGVAVWHVRNKSEHCINHTFHCVRENCAYLADAAARWPVSGLARFYVDERHARDIETLRSAGRAALICPYEITRAALAFNDVWIGDYNYVFAPRNRGLFYDQPGFTPARTLLVLDEAHNLPSRVADVYSRDFDAADAFTVRDELHRTRPVASLVTAWEHWCHFLDHLRANHGLAAAEEDDARQLLSEIGRQVSGTALDLAALGPAVSDLLWTIPAFVEELAATDLPRLWWSPADRELAVTCLDAASAIGATLREFGGVVLASATLSPVEGFAAACGLDAVAPAADQSRRPPARSRDLATTGTEARASSQPTPEPGASTEARASSRPTFESEAGGTEARASSQPTPEPGASTEARASSRPTPEPSASTEARASSQPTFESEAGGTEARASSRPTPEPDAGGAEARASSRPTPEPGASTEARASSQPTFESEAGGAEARASSRPTAEAAGAADLPARAMPERLGTLNKRVTKKLYRQLTTGAELLRVEESRDAVRPALLRARTPWRDASYDVAYDVRVDTTFQHRSLHYTTTASTIAALHHAAAVPGTDSRHSVEAGFHDTQVSSPELAHAPAIRQSNPDRGPGGVAVFFPSYAYAESIRREMESVAPSVRVAIQPRGRDLAAQSAWVAESLRSADVLFLVLGSSFAESIDALGGRIGHALVVGPALPEVNPVQRARLAEAVRIVPSREEAFRRVYQIPGMTKVNQALGRLVRAPGQRARVILHCRRFVEPGYLGLLGPEYQTGTTIRTDDELAGWLARSASETSPVGPNAC